VPAQFGRAIALAALLGGTMLALPHAAFAQTATPSTTTPSATSPSTSTPSGSGPAAPQAASPGSSSSASQTPAPASRAEAKAETVEQRIETLHTQLQITPQEEPKWKAVAETMRANAAEMEKMADESEQQAAKGMTAVDDLKTYEKFARAHVAGLRKLTSSFEALYSAMPAAQKKIADQVFDNFGHEHDANAAHS
jgi:cytoskeletal protein RodZ